jgi:two-component system response regulator DevR
MCDRPTATASNCRDLLSELPDLRCLMLTSFTSDGRHADAILAGQRVRRQGHQGVELAQAIKATAPAARCVPPRGAALMANLRAPAERDDPLTPANRAGAHPAAPLARG